MGQKITRLPAGMAHNIALAAGDDFDAIKAEIQQGSAELYQFERCFFVFRIEHYPDKREFVVVAAQGESLAKHCPEILKKATELQCDAIRFHTKNPKLGQAMRRWGAVEAERIYKVKLHGRQQQNTKPSQPDNQ